MAGPRAASTLCGSPPALNRPDTNQARAGSDNGRQIVNMLVAKGPLPFAIAATKSAPVSQPTSEGSSTSATRLQPINAGEPLSVPDMRFNRKIGANASKHFSTDGRELSDAAWEKYRLTALPSPGDELVLAEYFKNPNWIAPKGRHDGEAA